ncbi:MAG: mechanosensitive ion channel, partial [Candidatus Omnitrophica bacterium]|nr:mechanosensitive ion channel [Candidatus Omnitrophota bacterium]
MQDAIHKGYEYFVQYGMNVAAAIIIFVVGHMVSRFVAQLTEKAMASANLSKTLTSFGRHLVFYVAMTFVVIASLNKLGVETTSFIAVLGAASLAVGLALQGSLSNFASGVLIVLFQ